MDESTSWSINCWRAQRMQLKLHSMPHNDHLQGADELQDLSSSIQWQGTWHSIRRNGPHDGLPCSALYTAAQAMQHLNPSIGKGPQVHKWQNQVTILHLSPEILLSSLIGPRGVQQAHIHALWAVA